MGADFVHAVCPLPSTVTDKIKEEISKRLLCLSEKTVDSLLEEFHWNWAEEVDKRSYDLCEEDLFKIDSLKKSLKKDIAIEILQEALDEVIYSQSRRDVGHMFLDHKWWLISGGMSWGDTPTEAMNYIDILDSAGILNGLND
jgi:hypothetical protein